MRLVRRDGQDHAHQNYQTSVRPQRNNSSHRLEVRFVQTNLDSVRPAVNPIGGSGTSEGRDGACTPKWLADLLPRYDLDPCSNNRSHIRARIHCDLASGDNGLDSVVWGIGGQIVGMEPRRPGILCEGGSRLRPVLAGWSVFCNPPYARWQVLRWVRHYLHTNFTFLLRWDPSTDWFEELWPHCWGAWFPWQRMNFEPPPGVKFSSNPFPHALYFKERPNDETYAKLATRGYFCRRDQLPN